MAITQTIQTARNLVNDGLPVGNQILSDINQFVRGNPILSTAVVGVGTAGITAGVVKIARKRKSKRVTRRRKTTKRKTVKRTKSGRRIRRTPRTAGRGKDRSTKRIRYTKKGQPYVITRSGKAKFIKKTSARRSHRIKGGRY